MKVEVVALDSLSIKKSLMVSVDVKHHERRRRRNLRAQELFESRGGRHGLPVPNGPYGVCGRTGTWNKERNLVFRSCVNREVGMGSHSLHHSSTVPDKPYSFCGRKAP